MFGGFSKSNTPVNEIVCPENERLCSFEFMRAIRAHQFCGVANIQYVGFSTTLFRLDNDEMFLKFSTTDPIARKQGLTRQGIRHDDRQKFDYFKK